MKTGNSLRLIIYGPTATGKTALAIKLAKKYNGELISADSRQVYKGLDIGTGKTSFDSKVEKHNGYWTVDGVKVRGFDLVEPEVNFSVVDFLKFTHSSIIQITKLKKLPIIVGGTGFYIKALIDGIETAGIPENPVLRKKLEKLSREELYEYLLKINNSKAKAMNKSDRLNPRRLIRLIEISKAAKSKPSTINNQLSTIRELIPHKFGINYLTIGLTAPNQYLYMRADKWLQERIEKGMIDEVKSLLEKKINPSWLEGLGLEYRWLTRYLTGQIAKDQALERLKGDIHSFIRRQKTWFKQLKGIKIYDVSNKFWQSQLDKDVELWYISPHLR